MLFILSRPPDPPRTVDEAIELYNELFELVERAEDEGVPDEAQEFMDDVLEKADVRTALDAARTPGQGGGE